MGRYRKAVGLGVLSVLAAGAAWRLRTARIPLQEYTRYALYMAVLDDEICRNELEGNRIGGKTIVFPPKAESLQQRYQIFLRMNRRKDRQTLQEEIKGMERRLGESRQYLGEPKVELTVSLLEGEG